MRLTNTNRKAHESLWSPTARVSTLSDVGRAPVVMVLVWQEDGRGYCFEGVARAAETAVAMVEQLGSRRVRPGWDEDGTGACAGVAFVAASMADELTDCSQRRQVLAPALRSVLFVLDRIPGQKDEDEANELKARG